MIRAGIVGGAGYVGGELIRILLNHPDTTIEYVLSQSQNGKSISTVHKDLLGETSLKFSQDFTTEIDVLFLCSGHGASITFLENHDVRKDVTIIDLSRDFRIKDPGHSYVYGLTELNRSTIASNTRIANPGCFATCIQLALLPLAASGHLKNEVHVTAITGSTGAGQKPIGTTHFSWRNNNISVYKAFNHQHLDEIRQSVNQLAPRFQSPINFIPVRGNFTRGIFANIYTKCDLELDQIKDIYSHFYEQSPFVHISDLPLSVKDAVNTNKNLIFLEKHGQYCRMESTLDNLLKGAAGQAVQNMNVSLGLAEDTGLRLKPSAF